MNNDELKLMPGMTATVNIGVASAGDVLKVPNLALRLQPPADVLDTAGTAAVRKARGAAGRRNDAARNAPAPAAAPQPNPTAHVQAPLQRVAQIPRVATYGITDLYPEYEKSPYMPSHEGGRGRVFIVDSTGKLAPVFVRTGVTDGRYTEVTSPRLHAGQQIVVGLNYSSADVAEMARSPLTGGGSQRPMGGGFR